MQPPSSSVYSADEFHSKALRAYLTRFDFNHDPLDVALRKLLMDVGLPRETQQIDRVMEAFAVRYRECHPNLYISEGMYHALISSLLVPLRFYRSPVYNRFQSYNAAHRCIQ